MRYMDEQMVSMRANIRATLDRLGIDTHNDKNFQDTAKRFLNYLISYMQPYDPGTDLGTTFPPKKKETSNAYDRSIVVQVGIPYRAVCAHHLLPVLGTAHVGYLPRNKLVGLSKLTRLVYGISHALPSLQEDVCDQITDAIMTHLDAQGAMCVISAEHGCMAARGVEEASGCIDTVTSSVKGIFIDKHEARQEFFSMIQVGGG
jgi:GTP cyclohydrolase I